MTGHRIPKRNPALDIPSVTAFTGRVDALPYLRNETAAPTPPASEI